MTVKINGQVIPEEAIEFEFSRLVRFYSQYMSADQIKAQMEALKDRAKEQAIGAKLLIDEAARMDLKVTTDQLDEKMKSTMADVGGEEEFKKAIESQGLTEEMVRKNIEEGCRVDVLVAKITEGVADPEEKDIEEHFKAHKEEYVKQERAQASHVLVKPASEDDADKTAAAEKIAEIKKRLEDGSEFGDEAKEHSDCPSGKGSGGSLGWFSRGMMVPEFDEEVFSMEVGALSGIVETQFGYHIISKTGHEDGGEAAFEDVKESIRDFLRHTARGDVISAYVKELRAKAEITEE